MDALPPPPLPEDLAHRGAGIAAVEEQLQGPTASAIDALAMDPNRLPLLKLEDTALGRFSQYLTEEVCAMVAAAGSPYVKAERDLSRYEGWRALYYGECRRDFEWTAMKMKERYPDYTYLERIQDLVHVVKNVPEAAEADHIGFVLAAITGSAFIAPRVPDSDTIRALALYAFAHFIVPVGGRPSLVSRVTDPELKEAIFHELSLFCNNPGSTPDIRGAYILLAMYAVLNLDMPLLSRMEQLQDFFFRHMQPGTQRENIKEKLLKIYLLIARSDPVRYGNLQIGKGTVECAQRALMVSCPYISEELTETWKEYMQSLIDAHKAGQLEISDLDWMKKEAQELITPSNPDAPRCHPSAHPVLRQLVEL